MPHGGGQLPAGAHPRVGRIARRDRGGVTRGRAIALAAVAVIGGAAVAVYPRLGKQDDGTYLVPTGQRLTPAGQHIEVNDRPLGMVLSPDGSRLAVVTGSNFAPRALHLLDAKAGKLLSTERIGDSFVGVAFSPDGKTLYIGGGASNEVKVLREGAAADA